MSISSTLAPVAKAVAPLVTKVRANSPTILLVGGCACVVGGGVLLARAGWKSREHLYDAEDYCDRKNVSDEDSKEIHRLAAKKMAKEFVLPAAVTVGGVAMVIGGHHIQAARLAGAVAAYAVLEESYENYRRNVIADQGPSADVRYLSGARMEKTDLYEEDEEGKLKKKKGEVLAMGNCASPYAELFDEANPNWENDRATNLTWLMGKQERLNYELMRKPDGIMMLNEVLEELGFPRTPEGALVGWEYKPDPNESLGDGYIDFGLQEIFLDDEIELARTEHRNPEPSFWLNFNVDGMVYERLGIPKL